ncbi:hypothetical protein ACQBAU_16290 [Propionibacteriaceae bacterium Y2011]
MAYTYPFAHPEGTLTPEEVHRLLSNSRAIARRLRTLADQRFIADFLLGGRFSAAGGGIFYEDGQTLFAADDPEAVAPGAEYPLTVMTADELAAAKTTKWGHDSEVYDETIARLALQPVDRTLRGLVNSVVRLVDSVALAVVGSKVVATYDATAAPWTSGENIVTGVLSAKAAGDNQGDGAYDMDTVVLTPVQFAKVMAFLINGSFLPREQGNPVTSGMPVDALGITWTTSPHAPFTDPILVDRDQLGGMADENIQSPGYVSEGGIGVESKVQRLVGADDRDGYRLRARRVTVPVVTDPNAGIRITGTGL